VAQLGSALDWGSRGRRFKSCQPDGHAPEGPFGPAGAFVVLMLGRPSELARRLLRRAKQQKKLPGVRVLVLTVEQGDFKQMGSLLAPVSFFELRSALRYWWGYDLPALHRWVVPPNNTWSSPEAYMLHAKCAITCVLFALEPRE
jgi:hypothetical protein